MTDAARKRRKLPAQLGFIFALLSVVCGYFLFSLFNIQVLQHRVLKAQAAARATSAQSVTGPRGSIYAVDKSGQLHDLAESEWQYQLLISPEQVKNKNELVATLSKYLPKLDQAKVLSVINNNKAYVPPVYDGIDVGTAGEIANQNLLGVYLIPKLVRVYPNGQAIAPQVIGFLGANGQGEYGLEGYYNSVLQGKTATVTSGASSLDQLTASLGGETAQAGSNLVTSIDYNLQYEVETQLSAAIKTYQADSGSVVVMNPKTGAVLAMAGEPDFDPSNYGQIPTGQDNVYLAPAISNVYEPGSVFKALNMSAALDTNTVQPSTTHNAGGSVTVDGATITNALNKDFGNETMSQIIQNSDNVQMVWISSLLGADKERQYQNAYGVGQKTNIDLDGEQVGTLPKLPWSDILRSTAAFGQGVSTTVIQLADAYAAIANGGTTITPHVVQKIVTGDKVKNITEPAGQKVISAQTDQEITQMLIDTVNLGEGKHAGIAGVQVAGKTGTAQVPSPQGGYDPTKSIGSFAGFFPASNPQFVMVVRLDNPKTVNFAESSAAPTFGLIANWMANYYGLR